MGGAVQELVWLAVPHAVRMKPLLAELESVLGSTITAPAENVADPEPRQGFVAVIQKQVNLRRSSDIAFFAESSQDRGSLRPQRAVTFLPAFAKQPHLKRLGQLEVTSTQISNFLHSGSGIKHGGQESVVATSFRSGPVNGFQNGSEFFPLQRSE